MAENHKQIDAEFKEKVSDWVCEFTGYGPGDVSMGQVNDHHDLTEFAEWCYKCGEIRAGADVAELVRAANEFLVDVGFGAYIGNVNREGLIAALAKFPEVE